MATKNLSFLLYCLFSISLALSAPPSKTCPDDLWSQFKDSMDNGYTWYIYAMKVVYPFQKEGMRCLTFESHQNPLNPSTWTFYMDFVDNNGHVVEARANATRIDKNDGLFLDFFNIGGHILPLRASLICGEVGDVDGKMLAFSSCDPQVDENGFWFAFDQRRTKDNITPEELVRLENCMRRNNVTFSMLTYVDNSNCLPYV